MRPGRPSVRLRVVRHGPAGARAGEDRVAVEAPLEVRVTTWGGGEAVRTVAITMRTPGHDEELAVGFLFSEGLLAPGAVTEVAHCTGSDPQHYNVVEVRLAPGRALLRDVPERAFPVSSACGVCGAASLDAVEARGVAPLVADGLKVEPATIVSLPDRLREAQTVFARTGGLHAAGLFDPEGKLRIAREDVGRHNAVDKVVGHAYLGGGLPLGGHVLVVSGRASFEIVQKAAAAGVPMLVAVGAPSSLAVETARRFNLTLAGFTRDGGFNVYAGEERIG